MRTPQRAAELLVSGTLSRVDWPELHDEEFAADVRERLSHVGLEFVAAAGRWLARPAAPPQAEDGYEPTFELHSVHLAMIAALYLHLRFLPRQAGAEGTGEEPSVGIEDILRPFTGYSRQYLEKIVLGHLRNAGFVERRVGRYYVGPYLAAINEIDADERAQAAVSQFVLRRFLRRRVQELEDGRAAV
jgi:hypothetical protein